MTSTPHILRAFPETVGHRALLWGGIIVLFIGNIIVAGWVGHFQSLLEMHEGWPVASLGTGFCLVLSAGALLASALGRWKTARSLAGLVTGYAALALLWNWAPLNLRSWSQVPYWIDMAMTGPTGGSAATFLLFGSSLLSARRSKNEKTFAWDGTAAGTATAMSAIILLGYASGAHSGEMAASIVTVSLHVALGQFVMCAALGCWVVVRDYSPASVIPRWVPLAVSSAALASTLTMWNALRTEDKASLNRIALSEVEEVRNQVTRHMQNRVEAVGRFAEYEHGDSFSRDDWKRDIILAVGGFADLCTVAYVSPDMVVRHAFPEPVATGLAGRNMSDFPGHLSAIQTVHRTSAPTLSTLMTLTSGEKGFVIVQPLGRDAVKEGYLLTEFRAGKFLNDVRQNELGDRYQTQIWAGNDLLLAAEHPETFKNPMWLPLNISPALDDWHVEIVPSADLYRSMASGLPWMVLALGTVLSGVLGYAVRLWMDAVAKSSDLQNMNAELLLAHGNAEAAIRTKSMFLANMSHEIRTPMNAVIGFTNLLFTTPLDLRQCKYLQTIRDSASALLGLINEVLDFSKVEAGKMSVESTSFEIRPHIESIVRSVAVQAANKGLSLKLKVHQGVPVVVCGDPHRIGQIILNLVSNAVKFTQAGEVRLDVRPDSITGDWATLHFSVSDTGIGIPADQIANIFEAFTQADNSTTRLYGGSGLGLSISKGLVELMNGRMWVESQIGQGSTFHFTIRLGLTAMAGHRHLHRAKTQTPPPQPPQFFKILLVEDNPINRLLAETILKERGHTVVEAENGLTAVEKFQNEKFDVILMDVQMPEMDGYEAASRIREIECETGGQIRIIALTANAMSGDREKCLSAGMNDYLAKPIDADELLRTIELPGDVTEVEVLPEDEPAQPSGVHDTIGHPTFIDYELLEKKTRGKQRVIHELVRIFSSQGPDLLRQLHAAVGLQDTERLIYLAHTLKGSISHFTLGQCYELVRMIETSGRAGEVDWQAMTEDTGKLDYMVTRLIDELESFLSECHSNGNSAANGSEDAISRTTIRLDRL